MWPRACNIDLKVIHVSGKSNTVVNLLSRWFSAANNFQILPRLVHPVVWVSTSEEVYTDESLLLLLLLTVVH